ncbi:MAG TPA: hypothetical protein VI792_01475 [Candidatus Eisenbacteria bacterium]
MPKPRSQPAAAFEWRSLPPMAYARWEPQALPLEDGRVLVVGRNGQVWNDRDGWIKRDDLPPEVLDGVRAHWTAAPELVRANGALAGVRGLAWDARGGRWTPIERLPERTPAGTLALPDGTTLTAGGKRYVAPNPFATALDRVSLRPPRGRARTRRLRVARADPTLTRLPDGRVLVTGGYRIEVAAPDVENFVPVGETEVIDPAGGTIAPGGTLAIPRYGHAAAALPDGTILLAGGADGTHYSSGAAEIGRPLAPAG